MGKKRKLVDVCGHEMCQSCMFRKEACPGCHGQTPLPSKKSFVSHFRQKAAGKIQELRPQLKTNGYFAKLMQFRGASSTSWKKPCSSSTCELATVVQKQRGARMSSIVEVSHGDPGHAGNNRDAELAVRGRLRAPPDEEFQASEQALHTSMQKAVGTPPMASCVSSLTGSCGSTNQPASHPRSRSSGSTVSLASLSSSASYIDNALFRRSAIESRSGSETEAPHLRSRPGGGGTTSCKFPSPGGGVGGCHLKFSAASASRLSSAFAAFHFKPLFFEVPSGEEEPLFVGRHWIFQEIAGVLASGSDCPGLLIVGEAGSGKTACILQLVERSCFGRRRDESESGFGCRNHLLASLSSKLVAYHFCQAGSSATCQVPEFVHSLAAQLCQAPQLRSFYDLLATQSQLQALLSMNECISDPDRALVEGILAPLRSLRAATPCFVVVDSLHEAEQHAANHGSTISSFLLRNLCHFPVWFKVVATCRPPVEERGLLRRLRLDDVSQEAVVADVRDYVTLRVTHSPSISSNVTFPVCKKGAFVEHLSRLSRGNFLYSKMCLDLVERGHVVVKSTSFRVLPTTLAEVFILSFNIRFPTMAAYDKVRPLLDVCLAAADPPTAEEIFYATLSAGVVPGFTYDEFCLRMKVLSSFVVRRRDETYMFFHPCFKEWLLAEESGRFRCDVSLGHAYIALRLSRVEAPLEADKTLLLAHHILQAKVFSGNQDPEDDEDLQSLWLVSASLSTTSALTSRLLLASGADPDACTARDAPLLHVCAAKGFLDMAACLLEFGANVNLRSNRGATPLSLAARAGHLNMVKFLMEAGANMAEEDDTGHSSLVHAASKGHLPVVSFLLSCPWTPGPRLFRDVLQQCLCLAAANDHLQVVEFLLDVTDVDVNGVVSEESALGSAARAGRQRICAALLQRGGCDVTSGESPALVLAAREGHWEIVELLLQWEALVDQTDASGRTALLFAAEKGHIGIVETLLSKGSDLDHQDREGLTALGCACLRGHSIVCKFLVEMGADIDHVDKVGRTPLSLAIVKGDFGIVQFLIGRGAQIEKTDVHGMRPLDRSIAFGHVPLVKYFLRKGARLGQTTWTAAAGKPEILYLLLRKLHEDGLTLLTKLQPADAACRFQYALKKFAILEDADPLRQESLRLKRDLFVSLSRCKREMNKLEEAREAANQALRLDCRSAEAHRELEEIQRVQEST